MFDSCSGLKCYYTSKINFIYQLYTVHVNVYGNCVGILFYVDGNVNSNINNTNVQMHLKDVLQFITGADCVPPLGFGKKITIGFYDQEEGSTRLPYASTCSLNLALPRGHENYVSFSEMMKRVIFESCGFGKP